MIMNKKHFSAGTSDEPINPHFNIAVIGVGRKGCAALRQYQSKAHNIFYADKLYFCEAPFAKTDGELLRIIEKCPILFWLVDLHDTDDQQVVHTDIAAHQKCHRKEGMSVCITYQSQKPLVDKVLTDCVNLMVFVDDRLDSLSLVTETLLDDFSETGLVGMDVSDVFSVLRLCRTMYYFRRSGKDLTKINEVLYELKKDAETLPCADSGVHHNGIVSIKADYTCGLEVAEQVAESLEDDGHWVNQITFHSDESEKTLCVSLLIGW